MRLQGLVMPEGGVTSGGSRPDVGTAGDFSLDARMGRRACGKCRNASKRHGYLKRSVESGTGKRMLKSSTSRKKENRDICGGTRCAGTVRAQPSEGGCEMELMTVPRAKEKPYTEHSDE
jgi:hypothetical protein